MEIIAICTCGYTLLLATGNTTAHLISDQGVGAHIEA